jgi:two-component system sensor histidine kinase DesK
LFVTSWLVFVIINPVATMLEAADTSLETLATAAWAIAFVAAYLRLVLHQPFRADVTAAERRIQAALLLVVTSLVLYVDLAFPSGFFWLFIYVIIPAGVLLPTRSAAWAVVAITVLAIGVEVARSEWAQVMAVPGIAIWGVSAVMLRRLMLTVDELRTAREERARLAVAEERLRFARDLHDLLGHSLSLITLKSELAGRLMRMPGDRAEAEIADIERVARRALREVREAVAGYRCPTLADELAGAREALAAAGIEPRIDAPDRLIPPGADGVLAWVVREGVTNVIRHSDADRCAIRVEREDGVARVSITDDGRGVPGAMATAPMGSGLAGIAERVAGSGGRVEAGPGDAGGFALRVTLPVDHESGVVVPTGEAGPAVPR